jgi:hypothetical protein
MTCQDSHIGLGGNSHQALSFATTRRVGGEGKQEGEGVGNERGCCSQKGIYGRGKRRTNHEAITLIIHPGRSLPAIPRRSFNFRALGSPVTDPRPTVAISFPPGWSHISSDPLALLASPSVPGRALGFGVGLDRQLQSRPGTHRGPRDDPLERKNGTHFIPDGAQRRLPIRLANSILRPLKRPALLQFHSSDPNSPSYLPSVFA